MSVFNSNITHPLAQRDVENDIKFDPPVFKQRYERVSDVLLHEKWKDSISKVVDFGCAELGLFTFLKNMISAREMVFVDIDEHLLQECMFRVFPLNADYLRNRPNPLNVKLCVGSVTHPDKSLQNTDAVVAVELIEHLYPDTLQAFPYNVFAYIRPKLVIVTTPNADFNVLFTKLKKFRHADHKFEWTREQFQSWAENITLRFPAYSVQFDGVGLGPPGTDHLGCCSQLAVFIRKDVCDINCRFDSKSVDVARDSLPKTSFGVCTYYSCSKSMPPRDEPDSYFKQLASIDYPHYVDQRTDEEKLLDELKYRIHLFGNSDDYYNYEKTRGEIPLERLLYKGDTPIAADSEVRNLLLKLNYSIEECLNEDSQSLVSCVIYEPDMENGGSGSDTEGSGYDSDKYNNAEDADVSDWDDEDARSGATPRVKNRHLRPPEIPKPKKPEAPSPPQPPLRTPNHDYPPKLSHILSVFNNFDKINELDAVQKEKKFFNFHSNMPHKEVMKKICQEIAKNPVAGPSRDPRRFKVKKSPSSDSEDSANGVRSITTCILENSLNKIDVKDSNYRSELIELQPEAVQEQEAHQQEPAPVLQVQICDLSNNDSDDYQSTDNEHTQHDDGTQSESDAEEVNAHEGRVVCYGVLPPSSDVVAWASREALFDDNSQVDLLEDFDFEGTADFSINNSYVPDNSDNAFPDWLMQIFENAEALVTADDDLHDEPHYYCQGDGLGVHPSIVGLNDDDDDEGNESGSDSSSSGSVTFANAEGELEEPETPDDEATNDLTVVGQTVDLIVQHAEDTSEQEEEFQSAQGSESNLVAEASNC